jgi:hypothetical protein
MMGAKLNSHEDDGLQEQLVALLGSLDARMRAIAEEVLQRDTDLRAFTYKELEERFGWSDYTVRKMIAEGKLQKVYATDRTVRVTARSVRIFLYGDKVGG